MSTVYLYDGSFNGLLTAIFYGYTDSDLSDIRRQEGYQPDLLSQCREIATEDDKAQRIINSVSGQFSPESLRNLYYLYLGETPGCEYLAYRYLKLLYHYGDRINMALQQADIYQVDILRRKIALETQRFRGFVRFTEIAPLTFYSVIEPDHNQLPLLAPFFVKRFADQRFIIHDTRRQYALVYQPPDQHWFQQLTAGEEAQLAALSLRDQYQALFKTFYQSVTIPERLNLRQQKQFMPKRYWKHIFETQSD